MRRLVVVPGVLAVCAVYDGRLMLDEKVSITLSDGKQSALVKA